MQTAEVMEIGTVCRVNENKTLLREGGKLTRKYKISNI